MELSEKLINNILGYLSEQPYMSVAGLINNIQKECIPKPIKKEDVKKEDKKV